MSEIVAAAEDTIKYCAATPLDVTSMDLSDIAAKDEQAIQTYEERMNAMKKEVASWAATGLAAQRAAQNEDEELRRTEAADRAERLNEQFRDLAAQLTAQRAAEEETLRRTDVPRRAMATVRSRVTGVVHRIRERPADWHPEEWVTVRRTAGAARARSVASGASAQSSGQG